MNPKPHVGTPSTMSIKSVVPGKSSNIRCIPTTSRNGQRHQANCFILMRESSQFSKSDSQDHPSVKHLVKSLLRLMKTEYKKDRSKFSNSNAFAVPSDALKRMKTKWSFLRRLQFGFLQLVSIITRGEKLPMIIVAIFAAEGFERSPDKNFDDDLYWDDVAEILNAFDEQLEYKAAHPSRATLQRGMLIRTALVVAKGLIRDRVEKRGLDSLDDQEFTDWLERHDNRGDVQNSTLVESLYELAIGHDSETSQRVPRLGAGIAIRGLLSFFSLVLES